MWRLGFSLLPVIAAGCAPRPAPPVETLLREMTGDAPAQVRVTQEWKMAYRAVLRSLIVEMGREDVDVRLRARQSFGSICLHAGRPGAEIERRALCEEILRHLGPSNSQTIRVVLLRQLGRIGGEESVAVLARLLRDRNDQIREAARTALQNNSAPEAADALRAALADADDSAGQAALIQALAGREHPPPADVFVPFIDSPDGNVTLAAVSALGSIHDDLALKTLYSLWQGKQTDHDEAVEAALLRAGQGLLESGREEAAAPIFHDLYQSGGHEATRQAALWGLSKSREDEAVLEILEILRSPDESARHVRAARLLQEVSDPEITTVLTREFNRFPRAVQPLVIEVFAARSDVRAKPVILAALRSNEADVRLAALKALALLGDSSDVVALAEAASESSGEECRTARQSLARLRGDEVDAAIAQQIQSNKDPTVRAELIRGASSRRMRAAVPILLTATGEAGDSNEPQVAAFEALKELAGEADLPGLIELLIRQTSDPSRAAAEDAVAAVGLRIGAPDIAARLVIDRLEEIHAHTKAGLIRVLGRIGGRQAREAVCLVLESDEAEVSDAAVRALSEWKDATVLDDLLHVVRADADLRHRVAALTGYVRLVRLPSSRPPLETLGLLDTAMQLAERTEDQKTVLSAMGDVIELEALRWASMYLLDEAVRSEAAVTVSKIVRGLSATHHEECTTVVEEVLALELSEAARRQARESLEFMERRSGYIHRWHLAGPYYEAGLKAGDLFDRSFPPEVTQNGIEWIDLSIMNPNDPWTFDLAKSIGGDDRCVYVQSLLWSAEEQPALLEIGSDDAVKVWLNDELVHSNKIFRPLAVAEDKVPVHLRDGWNLLMLKIVQGGGGWGFVCGVKSPDGSNLPGLELLP